VESHNSSAIVKKPFYTTQDIEPLRAADDSDNIVLELRRITPLHRKFLTAQWCARIAYKENREKLPPVCWGMIYHYFLKLHE
jgi:hypothetical protein